MLSTVIIECKKNKAVLDNLLNVFALVRRGKCEFETKVLNVQNAGYNGAIIYDPNSNGVIVMHGERRYKLEIPAMYVGKSTAKELIKHYLYKPGLDIEEQNFVLMVSDDDSIINYLLPFTLIVAVCLVTMMVFSLLRVVRQWRAHRKARLTKRKLKKLPKKKYSKENDAADWETCAICIEDYEDGDMLRILPCKHAYHIDCIDPWLTRSRRNCPLCKRSVLSDEESSDNGNGTSEFSVSTSEASENRIETDANDETPLLEEARDLASRGELMPDFTDEEEILPEINNNDNNNNSSSRNANMITRFLRSVQSMRRSFTNGSGDSLENNYSDYVSENDDNDEAPLIVRTTLRRQGAIRGARRLNSAFTSDNDEQIGRSDSPNFEHNFDESISFERQASEDELPLTSDDNNSSSVLV